MKALLLLLIIISTFTSCYKKEFLPPEVGNAIPYEERLPTFDEAFSASPYTLFLHAWRRSTAHRKLNLSDPDTRISLLVPDNAAMLAAGYDLPRINTMALADLDSLVLYHTSLSYLNYVGMHELDNKGNVGTRSALTNDNGTEIYSANTSAVNQYSRYHYKLYVGNDNGKLLVNGIHVGKIADIIPSIQVMLIPIGQVLQKPTRTTWEYLQKDGRFTLYLRSLAYTDSLYSNVVWGSVEVRSDAFKSYCNTTLLVPTDAAFHKAGMQDFEDVKKIIHRIRDPYSTPKGLSHFTPIDSILDNHWWSFDTEVARGGYGHTVFAKPRNGHLALYTNDLKNNLWGGNYVHFDQLIAMTGARANTEVNLTFSNQGSSIFVHLKESNYPDAEVIERDILTLSGVVQVLDRLLIPKDFKLN